MGSPPCRRARRVEEQILDAPPARATLAVRPAAAIAHRRADLPPRARIEAKERAPERPVLVLERNRRAVQMDREDQTADALLQSRVALPHRMSSISCSVISVPSTKFCPACCCAVASARTTCPPLE